MLRSTILRPLTAAAWAVSGSLALTNVASAAAADKADCVPAVEYCEKTVCEPMWCVETVTIKETKYRKEKKTREVPYYKQVKVEKTLECKHTVFVKEKKVDEQKLTLARPVCKTVEQKHTVMVPREEIHKGTRKVCRLVPGTCDQYETVEEPYECKVTICRPEERTCLTKVWETQKEEKVVKHEYCTLVPKVISKPYTVTLCEWQRFTRTETYEEDVPYTVERKEERKVCKMVPKTVRVPTTCCD